MKRAAAAVVCAALLAAGCSSGSHPASITVGAIYPLSGSQGPGGTEEYRGVRLAVDMVNAAGGIGGRSIRLSAIDVPGSDGLNIWVPVHDETAAVVRLASQGIGVTPGTPFDVVPGGGGHIRVTSGLVPEGHEELAATLAGAANTSGWGERAR